jgi:hypothetical protein
MAPRPPTTMTASLPAQFFLYFPNRHSQADPHSGFVLVDAVKEGTAWRVRPRDPSVDSYTLVSMSQWLPPTPVTANVHHDVTPGLILNKTFAQHPIQIINPQGANVIVLELYKHTTVFSRHLKRNVTIASNIPSPAPAPQPKVTGTLSLHVARQLLELARMKREQCPIIMEDLMEGHTAVMPCGHLFSRLAIEESFKKEAARCPACRQVGTPTNV